MADKSPFILVEDFLPLEVCQQIIESNKPKFPQRTHAKEVLKTTYFSQLSETRLLQYIDSVLDLAEPYYKFETEEIKQLEVEWYPTGYKAKKHSADGMPPVFGIPTESQLINFTILFFLQDTPFGGKLEFPTHGFTIEPKAGTLLMFPSNANFMSTFTSVTAGDLVCARIPVKALNGYKYKKTEFPGNYKVWF